MYTLRSLIGTLLLSLLLCVLALPTLAQDTSEIPLRELLREDGTVDLNRAHQGSVNLDGFDVVMDASGQLRARAAGDEHGEWLPGEGTPGVNGLVWALAWGPDGALYVGGSFTEAGGVSGADRIARWTPDGSGGGSWSALGTGVSSSSVRALAWDPDGVLYVGGGFTSAGGVSGADRIARWTSSSGTWSALGTGVNNNWVYALAWDPDGVLYVGGDFVSAGGISGADRIARWTPDDSQAGGGTWSSLGAGVNNNSVRALAMDPDGALYIGGNFTSVDSRPLRFVARWTPDDSGGVWRGLVTSWSGTPFISTLAWGPDNALYVGGEFSSIGESGRNIARWTPDGAGGGGWSALGTGVNSAGTVYALAWGPDGALYVGGRFSSIGGVGGNIARWTPSTGAWSALGTGVDNTVSALSWGSGDVLYVGGQFIQAGGAPSAFFARWQAHIEPPFAGCQASSSGDWENAGSWGNCGDSVPGEEDQARIPSDIVITVTNPIAVATLLVEGTLIVEDEVRINEHLALAGTLTIEEPGAVVLASGPDLATPRAEAIRIASFSDEGGTLTGELTYERYLDTPQGWRFLGAPFAGVPFTSLSDELHTQGAQNTTFPTGDPILFTYDASQSLGSRWVQVDDYATTAEPGQGYLFFAFRDRVGGGTPHLPGRWTVRGSENAGPVTRPLAHGTDPAERFTFVANPFAGPLDWHEVAATPGVNPTYYVWDPAERIYRTYQTDSGLGDAGPFIAPFQGFFVVADEPGVSLEMTTAMKATDESAVVLPRPATDESPVAALTFALAGEGLTATRPSVVLAGGAPARYRAPWLAPVTSLHAAAYFADAGQRLTYAVADAEAIAAGETVELDLHVRSARAGTYTLSWPTWRAVPDAWQLTIVDRQTGQTVDLRQDESYTFTLAASRPEGDDDASELTPFEAAGDAADRTAARFGLVVAPQGVSADEAAPVRLALASAFPNPFTDRLAVRFDVPAPAPVRLVVYDVMGREVARLVDGVVEAGAHEAVWRASGVASGVYLVRLTSGTESQTRRVTLVR